MASPVTSLSTISDDRMAMSTPNDMKDRMAAALRMVDIAHEVRARVPYGDLADVAAREATKEPHDCMYSNVYNQVSKVLDDALGPDEEDGTGYGLAAEVQLLGRRYAALKRAALTSGGEWVARIAEIEAADVEDLDPIGA